MWTPLSPGFPNLRPVVVRALGRNISTVAPDDSRRYSDIPRYNGGCNTNVLKLASPNVHAILPYKLSYLPYTSNVVADVRAQKAR